MIFKNSNMEVSIDTNGSILIKHSTGAEVLIQANNGIGIKILTDDTIKSFDSKYLNSILVENIK
jgi:hypothetical protein